MQRLFKTQAESALRNSMQAVVLPHGADAIVQGYDSVTTQSGPDKAGGEAYQDSPGLGADVGTRRHRDSPTQRLTDAETRRRRESPTQRLAATGTPSRCHRDTAQQ